jgi:hypothetical protein
MHCRSHQGSIRWLRHSIPTLTARLGVESHPRSRPDHEQTGSNLGRPDSRYYFRLANHPLSFVAGYSSRTWEFLCLFPVSVSIVPEVHGYLCGAKGLCHQSTRCLNFSLRTHGLSDVRIPDRCQHTGRRISKRESFRTRLSKTRRPPLPGSERIMCRGRALEGSFMARSC